MNRALINTLMQREGLEPCFHAKEALLPLLESIRNQEVMDYFQHCLPARDCHRHGVYIVPLTTVLKCITPYDPLSSSVFPFGFIMFGGTTGGNIICVDGISGGVYWVDHERVSASVPDEGTNNKSTKADRGEVTYFEESKGIEVRLQGLNRANLLKGLPSIHPSIERFIIEYYGDTVSWRLPED